VNAPSDVPLSQTNRISRRKITYIQLLSGSPINPMGAGCVGIKSSNPFVFEKQKATRKRARCHTRHDEIVLISKMV
jgi:hypothetical protein